MKTLGCFAVLLCLLCAVLLALGGQGSAAPPQKSNQGPGPLPCAKPNPAIGYAPTVKLRSGNSEREIIVYNVDDAEAESHKTHDPICLSKSKDATIVWLSGSSKKFKIETSLDPTVKGQDPQCGPHPFLTDPPTEMQNGYFSGSLKENLPPYCVYELKFTVEGKAVSDPHIQKTP